MFRSVAIFALVACSRMLASAQKNPDGSIAHLTYCFAMPQPNGNVLYNIGFEDVQKKSISSICTNYKNSMSQRGVSVQCRSNVGAQLLALAFELGTELYTREFPPPHALTRTDGLRSQSHRKQASQAPC
jgi:hypothetical protein